MIELDTTRSGSSRTRLIGDEDVHRAAAIVAEVVERNAVPPPELPDLDWVEALEAADSRGGRGGTDRVSERLSDAEQRRVRGGG